MEDVLPIKIGENGPEGKCAICGKYVIKDGIVFRKKSVLCSGCNNFSENASFIEFKGKR
ncbi:MAG: hypothetical protein DK305_000161 [Chloroflexi bacterium]|nr:MAG: hypothetical protein DK305_000161 [Chloroflexota bacterium]